MAAPSAPILSHVAASTSPSSRSMAEASAASSRRASWSPWSSGPACRRAGCSTSSPGPPPAASSPSLRGLAGADALTSILVTSYDTAVANPYFFKRATSAAPTYLSPYRLKPIVEGAADRSLLDGGVFTKSAALDRSRRRAQAHDRQDDGVAAMAPRPGSGAGSRFLSIQTAHGMNSHIARPATPMARALGGGGPNTLAT